MAFQPVELSGAVEGTPERVESAGTARRTRLEREAKRERSHSGPGAIR